MLIDHTEVLYTFPVTKDFFTLLQLFQCQVLKVLSKASTLPFTRGKVHEGTCPVGRKINPDFPVSKASFYSATVAVIKPGYTWNIQHITENVTFFPSQYNKDEVCKENVNGNVSIQTPTEPSNMKQPLQIHPHSTSCDSTQGNNEIQENPFHKILLKKGITCVWHVYLFYSDFKICPSNAECY